MYCPRCNKLMELTYYETMEAWGSTVVAEQILTCECGVTYEFSHGAERFLDENDNEIMFE